MNYIKCLNLILNDVWNNLMIGIIMSMNKIWGIKLSFSNFVSTVKNTLILLPQQATNSVVLRSPQLTIKVSRQ